jgi:hypothetical protein
MNSEQLRIAIEKAPTPEARAALQALEALFLEVVAFESSFAQRIEASKIARGEGRTKLRKAKREEVASYEQDAIDIDRELTEGFKSLSAAEIIRSLGSGLASDLKFWKSALNHFHPAELPIGHEKVALTEQLFKAMSAYLMEFGKSES